MWKGRTIILCAISLIFGNFLGDFFSIPPIAYFTATLIFALCSLYYRKRVMLVCTMILLGAASLQISRIPAPHSQSMIAAKAEELKCDISDFLETIFPEGDELAIAKALTIGDKSDLTYELKQSYKASGAMHLLALSGLHIGIIYILFSAIFSIAGGNKYLKIVRSIIILLALWGFAVISGLSNSICRAVLMITIYEIAQCTSGNKEGPAALATSAIIIVLLKPEAPRDIGFQLSYCAVIAIYTIYPLMSKMLDTRSRILRYIWNSLALSTSCQMTTGILAFCYFGTFPFYCLITNLFSIPLVTIAMYLTVGALATIKVPFLGEYLAYAARIVIHTINKIMVIISSL